MAEKQTDFTVRWALFSFKGRIARQSFWLGALFLFAVQGLILARLIATPESADPSLFWVMAMVCSWPISIWIGLALAVKRLNDINASPFFAGLIFIPVLSMLLLLTLAFVPSFTKSNAHGAPPFPRNDVNA